MRASITSLPLLLAALLSLGSVSACSTFRKAKECRSFAQTVSAWIASAPRPDASVPETSALASEARATARRYEDLDRKLGALDVSSEELLPYLTRYRSIAVKAARALDDVARALENHDPALARKRRVEFDETARAEAPLVLEINALCRR